jgi:hypothetical protein
MSRGAGAGLEVVEGLKGCPADGRGEVELGGAVGDWATGEESEGGDPRDLGPLPGANVELVALSELDAPPDVLPLPTTFDG